MIVVLFDSYRTSMGIGLQGELVPNAQSRLATLQTASSGPNPRRWFMLPVVLTAMFMAGFDRRAMRVYMSHAGNLMPLPPLAHAGARCPAPNRRPGPAR